MRFAIYTILVLGIGFCMGYIWYDNTEALLSGRMSTTTPILVRSTYGSSTFAVDTATSTQGACLKFKKATTTGFIYCTAQDSGSLLCNKTSCE